MFKTFVNKSHTVEIAIDMERLQVQNTLGDNPVVACTSKSDMFRKLYDMGMEVSEIAKECSSHYSFVYGVISSTREIRTVQTESKSDIIRSLSDAGLTVGAIAKELNSNYSFIFSVVKKHKASKPIVVEELEEIVDTMEKVETAKEKKAREKLEKAAM